MDEECNLFYILFKSIPAHSFYTNIGVVFFVAILRFVHDRICESRHTRKVGIDPVGLNRTGNWT